MPLQDADVFLVSLELAKTLPCLAEPGRIIVIATPTPTLDEVLPLIAAISPSVIAFNPRTPSLTLRRQPGFITFYRDQVIVTQVKDVSEGLEIDLGASGPREPVLETAHDREAVDGGAPGSASARRLDAPAAHELQALRRGNLRRVRVDASAAQARDRRLSDSRPGSGLRGASQAGGRASLIQALPAGPQPDSVAPTRRSRTGHGPLGRHDARAECPS